MNAAAGYSGTPLPKKLGVKEHSTVALIGAPVDVAALIAPMPDGVRITTRLSGRHDVVVAFFTSRTRLEALFAQLSRAITDAGGLWIAWPKRASGVQTDITEDVVRQVGLASGLVDNKVCAIDKTWSGLRLVVRRADRGRRAP